MTRTWRFAGKPMLAGALLIVVSPLLLHASATEGGDPGLQVNPVGGAQNGAAPSEAPAAAAPGAPAAKSDGGGGSNSMMGPNGFLIHLVSLLIAIMTWTPAIQAAQDKEDEAKLEYYKTLMKNPGGFSNKR